MSSPQLYPYEAPDAEDFVVAWLTPLNALSNPPGGCASRRFPNDPLPFRMVRRVTGGGDQVFDNSVVSVHTIAGDADGVDADTLASRYCHVTNRRMLFLLDNPLTAVPLPDGAVAMCDYLNVVEGPIKMQYRDTSLIDYVFRYEIGFTAVPVAALFPLTLPSPFTS
jgi:hypothetical protein